MTSMNMYEAAGLPDDKPAQAAASDLQAALARFPSGVVLVTTGAPDENPTRQLVRSFGVLSPASALVTWTVDRHVAGAEMLKRASQWTVHLLAYDQAALCDRTAAHAPLPERYAATLQCRRVNSFVCEDSLIVVGKVIGWASDHLPPLIRHDGNDTIAIDVDGPRLGAPAASTATSLSYLLGLAFFHLYGKMREEGGRLGFDNIEMFVLTALGERSGRPRREIEMLLATSAHPIRLEAMDDLEARGLIVANESDGNATRDLTFSLTPAGREVFDQFSRAGLHIQADMERLLGLPETVALRALLDRFAAKVEPHSTVSWL
jgi:3-hydroxy-9,10-secoandrosta-1,3,5(10)-triene-9,17-dione monooxygenase reductase component